MERIDRMTLVGLVAVSLTIVYVLSVGKILHMLFNPLALVIVYGGTFSATLIAYPWAVIKEILPSLRIMLFPGKNSDQDMEQMIDRLSSLSEKAKRDGIEALSKEIPGMKDRFLMHGVQMLVDGLDHDVVKDNLAREIFYTRHNQQKVSGSFRTMATVAPIFGLLGTLMGIVEMLRNLSNPASMGAAMSNAVTATFYGIFSANVFIPIATKLSDHCERDIINKEMMAEGIMAIRQGDVPLIVRKKMTAFITAHLGENDPDAPVTANFMNNDEVSEDKKGVGNIWLIIFSDITTNLMLFFLMLFATTRMTAVERKTVVAGMESTVMKDSARTQADAERRADRERESDAVKRIEHAVADGRLADTATVAKTEQGVTITLNPETIFSPGSAHLSDNARSALDRLVGLLKPFPNTIIIEGHTDNVPVRGGAYRSNWELSIARAVSVVRYLTVSGLDPGRLVAAGYGEFHPAHPNGNDANRARNRRIEITLMQTPRSGQ